MSVVCKRVQATEESGFSPDQILDAIFTIFSRILAHTRNLEEKPTSIFDHKHKAVHLKQEDLEETPQSSDLDTTGSDNSSEEDLCCLLDKYDIENFVILCYKGMNFNEHMLILSMMFLDKILEKKFVLTDKNIHKTFFICMMEVQKFYEDVPFTNKDFAKLCGLSTKELLELEFEFMDYIDYNMNISDDKYFSYKNRLKKFFDNNVILHTKYL